MKKLVLSVMALVVVFSLAACSSTSTTATADVPGGMGTPPAMPLVTTEAPTETAAPTAEPTVAPTVEPTATLEPVALTIISAQYCLASPDSTAIGVGHFDTGETITALGRDASFDYYYIENPDIPGGYCWIWDNYVLVNGNYSLLPIIDLDQ